MSLRWRSCRPTILELKDGRRWRLARSVFENGLADRSTPTHKYARGIVGHCVYDRVPGPRLVSPPDKGGGDAKVLAIRHPRGPDLVFDKDGAGVAEDEEGGYFVDGTVDISDAVHALGFLFLGEEYPSCEDACDSNDDRTLDISDAVATLSVLFLGQGEIPPPGMIACQLDPTIDTLTCASFDGCRD